MVVSTCVATTLEKRRPLAVDAIIRNPIFTSTLPITIDAPPERVWPWIAQMGGGRAGLEQLGRDRQRRRAEFDADPAGASGRGPRRHHAGDSRRERRVRRRGCRSASGISS